MKFHLPRSTQPATCSITVIGFQVSYAIPLALRVIYRDNFEQGFYSLGKFSVPIHIMASAWVRVPMFQIYHRESPLQSLHDRCSITALTIIVAVVLHFVNILLAYEVARRCIWN